MVREQHRLRPLEVGVARNHGLALALREVEQGASEVAQEHQDLVAGGTREEARVGGDLVVA